MVLPDIIYTSCQGATVPVPSQLCLFHHPTYLTDSNLRSRGWYHHTTRRARRDHLRERGGYGIGHMGGFVREGKRLQGGRPLHLQKSLLLLGNYHIGFAGNPTLGMEKESSTSYLRYLDGWVSMRKRKFGDTLDKKPAPTLVRWSFLNLPPSFTPSVLVARGRRNLKPVLCLAKRFKHITVKAISVKLVCKHTMKNLGTLCFSSFLLYISGTHPG